MGRESYSIVVEMENAKAIDWHEVGIGLAALAREIRAATELGYPAKPQMIFVHPGAADDTPALQREIADRVPEPPSPRCSSSPHCPAVATTS
jgi:hypothetical protein